jgi:hypothetical protein
MVTSVVQSISPIQPSIGLSDKALMKKIGLAIM